MSITITRHGLEMFFEIAAGTTVADVIARLSELPSDCVFEETGFFVNREPETRPHSMILMFDEEDSVDFVPLPKRKKPTRRGKGKKNGKKAETAHVLNVCASHPMFHTEEDEAFVVPIAPVVSKVKKQTAPKKVVETIAVMQFGSVPVEAVVEAMGYKIASGRKTRRGKRNKNNKPSFDPVPMEAKLMMEDDVIVTPPVEKPAVAVSVKKAVKTVWRPKIVRATPVQRFERGFYRFDNYFKPEQFDAGWCIRQDGMDWFMYEFNGKRWCISNKLRNKLAHTRNGNGSCISVHVENGDNYYSWEGKRTSDGRPVKPNPWCSCVMSETERQYEEEAFFDVVSPRQPRANERKERNKKAHTDNGNGPEARSTESIRSSGEEIARDIEETLVSTDRSNTIDVQAVKPQDEQIPGEPTYLNEYRTDLVYRRFEVAKVSLTGETAIDTPFVNLDPFTTYYNKALNHNSSMSTFRDVHYDLKIEVVVQSLPAIAGIVHFCFDRFHGNNVTRDILFSYPTEMLDLSSKDSLEFEITMELPQRTMNTLAIPYGTSGVGQLYGYLATPMVTPSGMVMPASLTVFATPIRVRPYNLHPRCNIRLNPEATTLVAMDETMEQDMCARPPASNYMSPLEIAAEYGFHGRYSIPADAGIGYDVCGIDMHPLTAANDPPLGENNLREVCRNYSYFRGSMNVKLTLNLSKFQNMTLAAAFIPQNSQWTQVNYEAFAFTEIVFDEKHEAVINCKYSAGSNWLPLFVNKDQHQQAAFGELRIQVRTPLVSTAPYAAPPTLLVEIAAGPDFQVAHPRDWGKQWNQPALVQAEINPEVPRTFAQGTTNLYEDARLPVFYKRLGLSSQPWVIPITCGDSRAGVLGLLHNTHAAWSGALDFVIEFEGTGQCEIRYDPTKRFDDPSKLQRADGMPTSGYHRVINSRVNPYARIRVPFCSLYDYLPCRSKGSHRTLGNMFANGALFIQGRGTIRLFRAAGNDFKVHFRNSVAAFMTTPAEVKKVRGTVRAIDPIIFPKTNLEGRQQEDFNSDDVVPPVSGTAPPGRDEVEALPEMGIGDIMCAGRDVSALVENLSHVPEVVDEIRESFVGVDEAVTDAKLCIADVHALVPEIREMLSSGTGAFEKVSSVTDAICSLLSGPTTFAKAILNVAGSGVSMLKNLILSLHGSVCKVLEVVTPDYILRITKGAISGVWEARELALLYGVAIVTGAMAVGIEDKWQMIAIVAIIGSAIPVLGPVISDLFESLTSTVSAPAVKEKELKLEAPGEVAAGGSLLASIILFFMPKGSKINLHNTASVSADISKIYSGAKTLDECLTKVFDLIMRLPFVSSLLGSQYEEVKVLAQVDVQAYVDEVKEIMCTDFFNTPLTNDKVRQQERLWMIHKKLDKALPKVGNKTNFFFNTTLRRVMDEQHKMYKHAMTFKAAGRERFPPFIVMFAGKTRVGKSTMVAEMNRMVCKMMEWDAETDIYVRNPSDPYFTGLAQQKIFYVDDLHTNITADGADSDMAMIMSFGTNAPWAPRMAALDDKGRGVNALLGMFCTNTPGEPSYPGIRNTEAYLARRHLLVDMRRKPDVPDGVYYADYSHADFVLLDPHDPFGKYELDAQFKRVNPDEGQKYDFKQLWHIFHTRFTAHLIKERVTRHQRKTAGDKMESPPEDILGLVRELASHYEDVDFVPVEKVEHVMKQHRNSEHDKLMAEKYEIEVCMEAPATCSQIYQLVGENQECHKVLVGMEEKDILRAIGDIVYKPAANTFTWLGIDRRNLPLYEKLLEATAHPDVSAVMSDAWATDLLRTRVNDYVDMISSIPDDENPEEFYECIDEDLHDIIKAAVVRKKEHMELAAKLGCWKNKSFSELLRQRYESIPRWLSILLSAMALGGAVYFAIKGLKRLFTGPDPLEAPTFRNAETVEAQYQKEVSPAVAIPIRKTPLTTVAAQYAKEVSPSLALPLKKKQAEVLPPQYAKEVSPALAVPLKKKEVPVVEVQYAKEVSPSLALPLKKSVVVDPVADEENGRVAVTYHANPRASQEQVTEVIEMQSPEQIETAVELYRYGRCGKIKRPGCTLHFMFLDNQTILTNRHFWTVVGGTNAGELVQLFWNTEKEKLTYKFAYEPNCVGPVPDMDIAVYKLPTQVEGIRSSWGLIATEAEVVHSYPSIGVLIGHTARLDLTPQKLYRVFRRVRGETTNAYMNLDGARGQRNETAIFMDGYQYPAVTGGGTCGSLMILPHRGGKVFGIHSAAFQDGEDIGGGIASQVTQEMLKDALRCTEPLLPNRCGTRMLPEPVFDARERALDVILTVQSGPELFFNHTPLIDVTPYGLPVVAVVNPQDSTTGSMFTSYKPSPMNRFFPTDSFRVPAILRPNDKRAPYEYDPRSDILGKYNKKIAPLPKEELALVVEHLIVQFGHLYHPHRPTGVMSFEEAVNGVPGAPYYDAINFHTSPGLPYSLTSGGRHHKKASLFVETGTYWNGMPKRECINERCVSRFEALLSAARDGNMLGDVVFQEFMKDELLKRQKIFIKPATRGIANPPIDLLLAERAAFLPFIALLQYNRHKIDCQVGINPMSGTEWTNMIDRLKSNSDLVFDADYTAFDSTIHPTTLDAFADIANGTMGGDFYTQMTRKTLIRYVYDRVSQVTNVQVKIDQGMASGMPMTAVGNSVVNMIYLRVAWLLLARENDPEYASMNMFDRCVKAIVYGDDNVVTVKAEVAAWYNLRAIALVLEPYGILMTDGQKSARTETKPFSNWTDVRFLKRAFVFDEETRLYLAPLDKKTILDRIRFTKAKEWLPDLEMRIEMSLIDCVPHGKEYFEAFKFFVNSCARELVIPCFTVSYETERAKWETASCMLTMEAGGDVTFTFEVPNSGETGTFWHPDSIRPESIRGRWFVPLQGPRAPTAEEAQVLELWRAPTSTRPGISPPTTQGGMTLAELQQEFNRQDLVTNASLRQQLAGLQMGSGGGVTLQQLQTELDRRPCGRGLTLEQLRAELNARPSGSGGISLQQLRDELNGYRGVSLAELQRELNARAGQTGGLTLQQLREELGRMPASSGVSQQQLLLALEQAIPQHVRARQSGFVTVEEMNVLLQGLFAQMVRQWPQAQVVPPVVVPLPGVVPGVPQAQCPLVGQRPQGARFDVRYPAQPGDEVGNFPTATTTETQVAELLGRNPGRISEVRIAGRKYYRCTRSPPPEWAWVILHWNLIQILRELGARDPIYGTGQHGRWEWGTLSDNILNIAHALFKEVTWTYSREDEDRNRRLV